MIESTLIRQLLLSLTALVFVLLAARTLWQPDKVAAELGYRLTGPNGYSELHAIYVGLWIATALLAALAAVRVDQVVIGDAVALLVLGQPFGRLLAIARYGMPQGPLLGFFVLELMGGLGLLLVRPTLAMVAA